MTRNGVFRLFTESLKSNCARYACGISPFCSLQSCKQKNIIETVSKCPALEFQHRPKSRAFLQERHYKMTYFEDLTPYSYIQEDRALLLNVGWLDSGHEYRSGALPQDFIEKLAWLSVNATVNRTPGIHKCSLCPPMDFGFHIISLEHEKHLLGSAEIRVKGSEATYAAPDLLIHYVLDHKYRPPEDFIAGVLMIGTSLTCDHWSLSRGPHWGMC
jgi:hypothetical protein